MSEEQYEDWLEDDATSAQEDKALNIRTPLSAEEEEDIEKEQEFIPEQEAMKRIREVEIRSPLRQFAQIKEIEEIPEQLRPIIIEQKVVSKPEPVVLSQGAPIAVESKPTITRISFKQRFTTFFSRFRRTRK